MPIPTYVSGYPPDGSSLGQTKSTIRNNLDGTFQTLAVDHIDNNGNPGSKPAGYHTVIHSVPQGSDPSTTTGYSQFYSKTITSVTSDQAMFWKTGGGLVQQMTMNFTPTAATKGSSFLPGGIIIQWGTGSGSDLATVNFNFTFPSSLFSLTVSQSGIGNSPATQAIVSSDTNTTTNFRLRVNGYGGAIQYSYVAIGK